MHTLYDVAIPLVVHAGDILACPHKETCRNVFTAALLREQKAGNNVNTIN